MIALIAVFSITDADKPHGAPHRVLYSELLARVDTGDIRMVEFRGPAIEAHDREGRILTATGPQETLDLQQRLAARGASFDFQPPTQGVRPALAVNMLPIVFLIGVWIFFMRQMRKRTDRS